MYVITSKFAVYVFAKENLYIIDNPYTSPTNYGTTELSFDNRDSSQRFLRSLEFLALRLLPDSNRLLVSAYVGFNEKIDFWFRLFNSFRKS